MTRDEMIAVLFPALVNAGEVPVFARRKLWRMSDKALRRELLLRGLLEYDDPLPDDEEVADDLPSRLALLDWASAPVYAD